jgi:hypothetical protein
MLMMTNNVITVARTETGKISIPTVGWSELVVSPFEIALVRPLYGA